MARKCTYCGNILLKDDALFCNQCGKEIRIGTLCPHCGKPIKNQESSFCSHCGTRLLSQSQANKKTGEDTSLYVPAAGITTPQSRGKIADIFTSAEPGPPHGLDMPAPASPPPDENRAPDTDVETPAPPLPGKGISGKMVLLAGLGVVILVVVIAVYVMAGAGGSGQEVPPPDTSYFVPGYAQQASEPPTYTTAIPAAPAQITPEYTMTYQQTSTPLPTYQPTPQPKKPVEFSLDSGTQSNCGLTCRETTATLTNTGDETAHGVCLQLTAQNSDGELIYLNNGPNIVRCVGDMAGGQQVTQYIKIEADCGFLALKCIGKTLTLRCTATSSEKTQQFPDQVISV